MSVDRNTCVGILYGTRQNRSTGFKMGVDRIGVSRIGLGRASLCCSGQNRSKQHMIDDAEFYLKQQLPFSVSGKLYHVCKKEDVVIL